VAQGVAALKRNGSPDGRVRQALQVRQVGAGKAQRKHFVDGGVDGQAAGRAIVDKLPLPVAVALHGAGMNFTFGEVGNGLSQVAAVAATHVAPLVGRLGRQALRRVAEGLDDGKSAVSHKTNVVGEVNCRGCIAAVCKIQIRVDLFDKQAVCDVAASVIGKLEPFSGWYTTWQVL